MKNEENTPPILFENRHEPGHRNRVENLLKKLNRICDELEKVGFPELQTPENIDNLHTNWLSQFERVILERAKREMAGKTLAGLPLSDEGILRSVQMPDLKFFQSEGWKYKQEDFIEYHEYQQVICFNEKTRRYELHPENWQNFIDAGTIYLTGKNAEVWEKIESLKKAMADLNLTFEGLKKILDNAEDSIYPGMLHVKNREFFIAFKKAYLSE